MNRRWLYRTGLPASGMAITILYFFPIYWMYVSSLKSPRELFADPPTFFPHQLWLDAYETIIARGTIPTYIANSFFLAGTSTLVTMVLAVATGYGMSRIRSRWVEVALILVMLSQVLPPALMVTPIYIMFRQLNLVGTYQGAILAFITRELPFAIIMVRPIFLQIPTEIEEAARVDGCSRLSALYRIILPGARTGIAVVSLLVFMMAYGDYVYSAALLQRVTMQPATVGLYGEIGTEQSDWNIIMAFAALFVTPILVLFVSMQRLVVKGLMSGSIK